MSSESSSPPGAWPPAGTDEVPHHAVIDIGSNTVRMVVFEGLTRIPVPLFNEKAACGLGRGIAETNRLDADGVRLAIRTLTRFRELTKVMGVGRVDLLATAAVRDATDGADFAAHVGELFGVPVQVLSGAAEARLSAEGVLCSTPDADGLVADLGGGSLDLVMLDGGVCGDFATTPLGHLRLAEALTRGPDAAVDFIAGHLGRLDWLERAAGREFFAVGGAWRAVGRVFIEQTSYPLHILDNYSVPRDEAENLLALISRLSRRSLDSIGGVSRRRLGSLPGAAMAMRALLAAARPRRVVFCGYGMREGQLYRALPDKVRNSDPLVTACARLAERQSRFGVTGQEIFEWMDPLFPDEAPQDRRLRHAACLMSDVSWNEHPDYRAEHAFQRVLRLPFAGLAHRARAAMALAVSLRYSGGGSHPSLHSVKSLLSAEAESHARIIGSALRLAHILAGGVPGVLRLTRLVLEDDTLALHMAGDGAIFRGDAVERRFAALARELGRQPRIHQGD